MEKLSEKGWKPFQIDEEFDIKSGVRLESRNRTPGEHPFIGALDNSNGVVQFVSNKNASLDSNFLGVNYNGNGMGIGFYHPYECICTDDVKRFHQKHVNDSEELALFDKTVIEKQRGKFGYLYKFNARRMAKTDVLLPITDSGNPDYEYMAEYTKQIREKLLSRYCKYVKKRIAELGDKIEIPALNEKEWREFQIGDICTVTGTITTRPEVLIGKNRGSIPRITCAAVNNGLDDFYHNEATESGGVLTVDSAVLGTVFYQPYDFIATDHVEKLICKGRLMSDSVGLFLTVAITQSNGSKYQYGYKFSQKRIRSQIVMLPVTDSGEPDYEYMEQYVKNMMLRKYKQYLTFISSHVEVRNV